MTFTPQPEWVKTLSQAFFNTTVSQIILHGNVTDLVPSIENNVLVFKKLNDFLLRDIFGRYDLAFFFSKEEGLKLRDETTEKDFKHFAVLNNVDLSSVRLKEPLYVLEKLEAYFKQRAAAGKKMVVVFEKMETLTPAREGVGSSAEERAALAYFLRWGADPVLAGKNLTLVFTTESLSALNGLLRGNAGVAEIEIGLPTDAERLAFIETYLTDKPLLKKQLKTTVGEFVLQTNGLNFKQLQSKLSGLGGLYSPKWVDEFQRVYQTNTISQFILHGNIADFVRRQNADGTANYFKFKGYLTDVLFQKRDLVLTYSRGKGLDFRDEKTETDYMNYLQKHGEKLLRANTKDPVIAFNVLDHYLNDKLKEGKSIALILDYAEMLAPMGTNSFFSAQDRDILAMLLSWAKESVFLNSDMTIVLLTSNLNDVNQQLVRDPFTAEIDVPYPNEEERLHFVDLFIEKEPTVLAKLEMPTQVLAKNTAGLNLVQLRTLMAEISRRNGVFTYQELNERKKDFIESEAGGFLEFIETKYSLENVAGHKMAKEHLLAAARALKNGRQDVLPMGYLVNGPVGTGKTFLVSCFASDIGVPMVLLKNFRSQWQGVTESNLEKVLKLLKAMNPVAVMIDEADAYLGNRNSSGDSGVSSRVFSMIATFMSNTEHRGKIIWFLLTARPDLMPVDFKRQGRAEEHIALFYPDSVEEKKELLQLMLRKTKINNVSVDEFDDAFYIDLKIQSGADMEAALTRAKFKAAAAGLPDVNAQMIRESFDDFIPPTYPEEIELMNLAAVLECTSKELLPKRYQAMTRQQVINRIAEIKSAGRNILTS